MNLLLLSYNNYFNRIVKRLETAQEYTEAAFKHEWVFNINGFNPNDGVTTEQYINFKPMDWEPDYLVAVNEFNEINSRWFVMESVRTRNGQYRLTLKRDSIADFYEQVITSPCYVEKAVIKDADNPLIFNNEGMRLNQIKTGEFLLKDKTQGSWAVGYLARSLEDEEETIPATWSISAQSTKPQGVTTTYDSLPTSLKSFITSESALYMPYKDNLSIDLIVNLKTRYQNQDRVFSRSVKDGSFTASDSTYLRTGPAFFDCLKYIFHYQDAVEAALANCQQAFDPDDLYAAFSNAYLEQSVVSNYEGRIILKDGKEYRLEFVRGEVEDYEKDILVDDTIVFTPDPVGFGKFATDFRNQLHALDPNWLDATLGFTEGQRIATVKGRLYKYSAKLVSVSTSEVNVNIDNGARRQLVDAPYDMFCIPMDDLIVYTDPNTREGYEASDIALAVARAMKIAIGSWLYDVQVLPYCPIQGIIYANKSIEVFTLVEHSDYEWIKDTNGNIQSIMLFPVTSQGTIDIQLPSTIPELMAKEEALDVKVSSETIMARLCSPNYNGEYQFNPQKNKGALKYNVDFNYRPYNPYIHVAPVFKGLYGQDFNDARGLICGGDFSISMVDSAWTTYQIQNKNYQNIFDRQIENLDLNNSISKQEAGFQIGAGSISGAATGAFAGSVGGPYAAIAGAAVGGATSFAGGLLDYANLDKRMVEAKDYKIDMYNYGLGNIKALPYSLTKVTSLNENNKIFPFIEIYDCTDKEREAFRRKIKYGGMTVMEIATIQDYMTSEPSYLKGEMIRMEEIKADKHLLDDIYQEVAKGLFI